MAYQNQNKELTEESKKVFGLSELTGYPRAVAESLLPVVNVKPYPLIKPVSLTITDATTGTILTTSSSKNTYLIGLNLSYAKDVNSTSLYVDVSCSPKGMASTQVLRVRFEPLTAGQNSFIRSFDVPILLEKNTAVTLNSSTNVASIDVTATLFYYEEDLTGD